MSKRFNETIPGNEKELEWFYLQVVDKLKGTGTTLEEVDQRSNWPGAPIVSDLDRAIRELVNSAVAPLKAQISELERQLRNQQGQAINANASEIERLCRSIYPASMASKISDLERRIDSIEKSARF